MSALAEAEIERELLRNKDLINDPRLPIDEYNYSALRDRLRKKDILVSVPTIIERAKRFDCYKPRHKAKIHDREVVTTAIGALVQHDASARLPRKMMRSTPAPWAAALKLWAAVRSSW